MPYTLTIPSTTTSNDPKPYTLYTITITQPLRTTTLQKRYSDFTTLHSLLVSQAGKAPPVPLPAKSWFKRTVNNPELTEERRQGLETYLRAIETDLDARWRDCSAYRSFLNLGDGVKSAASSTASASAAAGAGGGASMSANAWLDLHTQLKTQLHEARLALTRRDQAPTATKQHEASAGAKKCLVKANTLILRLEDGLRGLAEGRGGGEKLGEGEVRRRKDLVGRARKEREGLEAVLVAWVVKNPGAVSGGGGGIGSGMATQGMKEGLFKTANSSESSLGRGGLPGSFPSSSSGPAPSGRRVFGAPAKETERTRELDNEGVLQLQRQIIAEQDSDVVDLSKVVRRMREMGVAINEELVEQGQLLDMLDQDVDRVDGKINIAKKRIGKIS